MPKLGTKLGFASRSQGLKLALNVIQLLGVGAWDIAAAIIVAPAREKVGLAPLAYGHSLHEVWAESCLITETSLQLENLTFL